MTRDNGSKETMELPPAPGRSWRAFNEQDPFNDHRMAGYINLAPHGRRYGALIIHAVDSIPCDQFVWATPKQLYPYIEDRKTGEVSVKFPSLSRVKVYEKLDGTNILAYTYKAPAGEGKNRDDWQTVVSYKTRLQPFMRDDFADMWQRIMVEHPNIPELVLTNDCNLSFELYGKQNQHMLLYDVGLAAALLFGVVPPAPGDKSSSIMAPDDLETGSLPLPRLIRVIDSETDMAVAYQDIRGWLDEHIQVESSKGRDGEDLVEGMEGAVWYTYTDQGLLQYKCKPEYVQDAHFLEARGIPQHVIVATIHNAFEDHDAPDFHYIAQLLLEEYSKERIDKKQDSIERHLTKITDDMKIRSIVLEVYRQSGLDFTTQKNQVMRHIANEMLADAPKGSPRRNRISKMAFHFLEQMED